MSTETEALSYDHIVEVALEHGFKLKPQVDGRMALNDYVIDFARAVYDIGHAAAKAEAVDVGEPYATHVVTTTASGRDQIETWKTNARFDSPDRSIDLYTASQLAAAVAAERERAARVCERIADDYNQRESLKYAELKTDAETGANECGDAIRAGAKSNG